MHKSTQLRWLAGLGMAGMLLGIAWMAFSTPLPPDSDNDGLLDSWETYYFGNLAQTGSGDPDGDGVNNLEEFQLGRNPTVGAVADTGGATKLIVYTPFR